MCVHVHVTVCIWSEDNLQESVLCFHHLGHGHQASGKCLEPLSHLIGSDMNVKLSLNQQSSWVKEYAEENIHEVQGKRTLSW